VLSPNQSVNQLLCIEYYISDLIFDATYSARAVKFRYASNKVTMSALFLASVPLSWEINPLLNRFQTEITAY